MKADFSFLNNKVNSHSESIRQLEWQMNQLSAQMESKPLERCANDDVVNLEDDHEKFLAVLTRSGKVAGGDVKVNSEANASKEKEVTIDVEESKQAPKNDPQIDVEETPQQSITEELQTPMEGAAQSSK
ncbi:hypothetical protein KY285_010335 [Solanum tuberosum]|nr:hypothetical protein KY289_010887 [Solanum tuberosum]KAH0734628.1 hypothetical protein KY285_010335 [Solanum tuberosum]